jgi:hypothetical protein
VEIKKEEYIALQEMFNILQQVKVSGANDIHLMSAAFSRLQGILQNIDDREKQKESNKEV